MKDYSGMKVSDLLKREKDSLMYEYDFGDGWIHKVVLEKVLPEPRYPSGYNPKSTTCRLFSHGRDPVKVKQYEFIGDPVKYIG
jgi:pRiA4b ORF-3-like protein